MKYIISIFFILISVDSFSQTSTSKEIFWKDNIIRIDDNKNEEQFLFFENAIFEDDNFLPVYSGLENITIKKNSKFSFKIVLKNLVFKEIEKKDLEKVKHLDVIGNKIEVTSKEYYSKDKLYLQYSFIPIRKNSSSHEFEKLIRFDYEIIQTSLKSKNTKKNPKYANHSVLSNGNWFKIAVNKSGIYKLTYEQLRNIGISDPENVRVFGNGEGMLSVYNRDSRLDDLQELKIDKLANEILFYAKGPTHWYYDKTSDMFLPIHHKFSDYAYYFLSSDYDSGLDNQIPLSESITESASENVNQFTDYYSHEKESYNLIRSGNNWYGEVFDYQLEYSFNLNFPNIIAGSNIKLKTSLLASSPGVSSFLINVDNFNTNITIPAISYSESASFAQTSTLIHNFNASGNNNFDLKFEYQKYSSSSTGWLDYFVVNVQRALIMSGNQMEFRYLNLDSTLKVTEFELGSVSQNIQVWKVSDLHHIEKIDGQFNGGKLNFKLKDSTNIELIAFNSESFLTPIIDGTGLGKVENQDLHGLPQTDYVIICHPKFWEQANELKEYYEETTDLQVTLVKPEQIYNEFSSGAVDVSAYRDFLRMFYKRAETLGQYPRYLLLFGNGSYDNNGINAGDNNTNYILTYQSDNSLSKTLSFVTDDFFGLLDDNEGKAEGLLDIGIGRFPVETTEQAEMLVNKTKAYNSSKSNGNWQNRLTFVADDGDDNNGNIHLDDSENLSDKVRTTHPEYNITKLYIGAFNQESSAAGESVIGVTRGVNDAFENGTLIFNYNGHGGESTLAHEKIVTINSIRALKNYNKLPVVMTATCEFSRFDDWEKVTAGEEILMNPNGGSIVMFSTTRLVYASPNFVLNNQFYNYIFENDASGEQYRLGEVMQLTKINSGSGNNKRNFTLLGDPAIQIAIPKYHINTDLINGKPVGVDTLNAASKVTIKGEITDKNNAKVTNSNGVVNLTVFDKFSTQQTLGQDNAPIVNFETQKNILYNGSATVSDGEFEISFIVPKDISYNIGKGKLSYYSDLEDISAAGYNNQIEIGGFSDNPVTSDKPMELSLFMNDSSFVSGGITDQSPKLLAYINSETGINTIGTGIGHDISAILDNDTRNNIILNDFYEAEKDTYKKGKIEYQFSELSPGNHTLSLKAWDVLNNSITEDIDFFVVEKKNLTIDKLFNYPNPFTQQTWFYFSHNQPSTTLEVLIQIISQSGKLVKTIKKTIQVDSYLSEGIYWDGLDDYGDKVGKGVYFYKLKVRNEMGETIEKIEKLLILK